MIYEYDVYVFSEIEYLLQKSIVANIGKNNQLVDIF